MLYIITAANLLCSPSIRSFSNLAVTSLIFPSRAWYDWSTAAHRLPPFPASSCSRCGGRDLQIIIFFFCRFKHWLKVQLVRSESYKDIVSREQQNCLVSPTSEYWCLFRIQKYYNSIESSQNGGVSPTWCILMNTPNWYIFGSPEVPPTAAGRAWVIMQVCAAAAAEHSAAWWCGGRLRSNRSPIHPTHPGCVLGLV